MSTPASSPAPGKPARKFHLLPAPLRNFVRSREIGVVMVAVIVGLLSGVLVAAISNLSQIAHGLLFDIPFDGHLSASSAISWPRALFVPIIGGALLSVIATIFVVKRAGQLADAIEANALYGGRVSFRGSLLISLQTLMSNGFGASVGLEAGYTQICAAISSHIGQRLAARRSDMRLLVACGAAGAISAAFSAPVAGAFYAFEVVLGAYTSAGLVPVIGSAVSAWLVARQLTHQSILILPGLSSPVSSELIWQSVLLGVICALASIGLMRAVAVSERIFQKLTLFRGLLRPIVGGAILGAIALVMPTILGAGHGAMQIFLVNNPTWALLAITILLKAAASAISLGSGFRGGLFFASLLLGALIGQLYSVAAAFVIPASALQPGMAAVAALAAVGTGVIGAPFCMVCLALQIAGDLSVTVSSVLASSVCALIVRELFGYTFATWRFHLRGEVIRGPQDVGWARQMNAASLMRTDFETAPSVTPISEARKQFPPGRMKQLVLRNADGVYDGIVSAADLHSVTTDDAALASLAQQREAILLPDATVREIMDAFERTETDVLAVVDHAERRIAIGTLSESNVLRAYSDALEQRNQEVFFR